jgi:hypothetical protein
MLHFFAERFKEINEGLWDGSKLRIKLVKNCDILGIQNMVMNFTEFKPRTFQT